jgi:hypothetical protein
VPVVISKEAQELAVEIGNTFGWALRAIECGLHSGYPRCCIHFFVEVWMPFCLWGQVRFPGQDEEWRDGYRARMRAAGAGGPPYIACPRCLLGENFVTPKSCDCHRYRSIKLAGVPRRSKRVA